ncbi:hypothetical protein [Desulfosediminicola sp.]|uniref:hypothetical protein n=1 Tax=Desulfosediminicola sp. TaxID=2886825 RepID=UPI003AF228EE
MKKLTFTLGTLTIVCLLAAGCAKETRVQQFWGTSYNLAKYNQIADLSAPVDHEPITGMEGAVSTKVMETYIQSFEGQKQEAKSYTIDLGM